MKNYQHVPTEIRLICKKTPAIHYINLSILEFHTLKMMLNLVSIWKIFIVSIFLLLIVVRIPQFLS